MSEAEDNADRSDETKTRILDATERLMVHYGYDKTTIADIAREAGISKSTLYLRWKKKDDLISAVFWRATRRFVDNWFEIVETDPDGGTYSGMFRSVMLALADDSVMTALFIDNQQILGSFATRPEMMQLFVQRSQMDMEFMKRLQDAGVLRKDLKLEATAYLLTSMRYGIARLSQMAPDIKPLPIEDLMEVMSDMIARYVEPDGGGNSEAGKAVLRDIKMQYMRMIESMEQQFPNMF